MQFIFGLLVGSLLTGDELIGVMFFAPFVLAGFALVGWGIYEAVVWFDVSAASYTAAAWYEWPWHWPGAYWAKELFEMASYAINGSAPMFPTIDESPIGWLSSLPARVVMPMIGILINVVIAMLPFIALSRLVEFTAWLKRRAEPSKEQTS